MLAGAGMIVLFGNLMLIDKFGGIYQCVMMKLE